MRKPFYAICKQQRCRSACAFAQSDQHLYFCCLNSIISLVSVSEISSIYLASVAVQASSSLTWSETPKTGFLLTWLIFSGMFFRLLLHHDGHKEDNESQVDQWLDWESACLFVSDVCFLLVSQLFNLLHAEVSYIIDTACHWTFFFFNITSFSYFLGRRNPRFFPFSNTQFSISRSVKLMCTQCLALINLLKHASAHISAFFFMLLSMKSNAKS